MLAKRWRGHSHHGLFNSQVHNVSRTPLFLPREIWSLHVWGEHPCSHGTCRRPHTVASACFPTLTSPCAPQSSSSYVSLVHAPHTHKAGCHPRALALALCYTRSTQIFLRVTFSYHSKLSPNSRSRQRRSCPTSAAGTSRLPSHPQVLASPPTCANFLQGLAIPELILFSMLVCTSLSPTE